MTLTHLREIYATVRTVVTCLACLYGLSMALEALRPAVDFASQPGMVGQDSLCTGTGKVVRQNTPGPKHWDSITQTKGRK